MNAVRTVCVTAGLLVLATLPLRGQPAPGAERHRWITEFGVAAFVGRAPGLEERRALLAWELGRTVPAGGRTLAVTGFAMTNDNQLRAGGRIRYHLLEGPRSAVWIGSGFTLLQSDDDLEVELDPGLVLDVGFGAPRALVVIAEAEYGAHPPAYRLGARIGSVAGAVLGLAVPLLLVVTQRD